MTLSQYLLDAFSLTLMKLLPLSPYLDTDAPITAVKTVPSNAQFPLQESMPL